MTLIGDLVDEAKAFSISRTTSRQINFTGTQGQITHDPPLSSNSLPGQDQGDAALRIAAAYEAVTFISDELASLPVDIVRRGDRQRIPQRPPEFRALWDKPNPDQSRYSFWATMYLSCSLWGNAYAYLAWTQAGDLAHMWPIDPSIVRLERIGTANRPGVKLIADGVGEAVNRFEERPQFIRIPYMNRPGQLQSLSPIAQQAQALRYGSDVERASLAAWENGWNIGGVITADEMVNDDVARRVEQRMSTRHGGAENAGRWAVMGAKGLRVTPFTMSAADAELLGSLKWAEDRVLGIWRVSPVVLGRVDRASAWGAGIAEIGRGNDRFTLRPWKVRFEMGLDDGLLWQTPYQFKLKFDAMLSASPKERAETEEIRMRSGQTSRERVLENNDERPFDETDTILTPLNTATDEDREVLNMQRRAQAAKLLQEAGVSAAAALAAVGLPSEGLEDDEGQSRRDDDEIKMRYDEQGRLVSVKGAR